MITATINETNKVMHQETGNYFLDVRFSLRNGDEVIGERSLGFPLDTPAEDIVAELKKYCTTQEADMARSEETKAFDEANASADTTMEALKGLEITTN